MEFIASRRIAARKHIKIRVMQCVFIVRYHQENENDK